MAGKISVFPLQCAVATAERSRGLTLVETVVALMIMGIAVVGLCSLVMLGRESTDRARDHYTAVNIGKNRLELARVFNFSELNQLAESRVVVGVGGDPDSNGNYRRTTVVSNITGSLKELIITVEIRDRVARTFGSTSERVQTYIADMKMGP